MARVPDLGKSCVERGPVHGGRVVGAQLEPGAKPRLLVIGRSVGKLDAEMSPAGKADHEHRLVDAREFDGAHRAAQGRLEALGEFGAPVRAREDMHVAA